jgi:peptide/nickel transport system ATP-binding protein
VTPTADTTLRISDLSLSYRRRGRSLRVVEGVSLEIARGEVYGLVGESGSGKSTIAMAIMRYLAPNAVIESGSIELNGRDVLAAGAEELQTMRGNQVAMVYQDPGSALNPTMRVGEQVAEVFRTHRGMNRAPALDAARGMLEKVRISDPAGALARYPHELSGGQQQRVMIAMALATDPGLLVLDEPTTGLDATVEAEVLDLIEALRREFDTSVLFISHNLGIVSRLCDRVGVLYGGRLVEEAPADALFAQPGHPYTLGLLRCVPRLGMRKDVDRLEPIGGSPPSAGDELAGCGFAGRCALVRDRCRSAMPPPEQVGPGRMVRCHFREEVPAMAATAAPARLPSPSAAPAAEAPAEVLLRVKDVRKTYRVRGREVRAVDGVSLEIRRGEVFGLVGESGSGKSSLAKCIVGLVDVDEGEIVFDGSSDRDRHVQMIFQNPDGALNPRHTVGRILRRAVRRLSSVRRRGDISARAESLADSVRLDSHYLSMRPAALSGGLKQRVGIARAFAGAPKLVLCDEPVSALDVSVQAAILNLLATLQRDEDVSYLFISHDLAVVRYLADRIGVMYLGELVDVGTADEVFAAPHHPYTEALLSAIPTVVDGNGPPRTRITLNGPQPSPADPPSGCRFHTRCPRAMDLCAREAPPWQRDGDTHTYRCHIAPDALRAMQSDEPAGSLANG